MAVDRQPNDQRRRQVYVEIPLRLVQTELSVLHFKHSTLDNQKEIGG